MNSENADTSGRTPWTHEYALTLLGSRARVFTALTDPNELRRWFAEHVEIEPREGGAFRFWGRSTYGVPNAAAARQRITRLEPDRALAFEWPFEGETTEVSWLLEPGDVEASTRFTLRHAFPAPPAVAFGRELVDDLWRLTLGNLDQHLRGSDWIDLPDYADPAPEIRMSILIDAPPAQVFRALVEPEALNQWIASNADVDPRKGGRYSFGWDSGPTRILELVPNERLVIDWKDWRGDETRPQTRVTWTLEPVGEKTRLTMVHDGFSRVADKSDYPFGWRHFLEQAKNVVQAALTGRSSFLPEKK
jgi:uncharacterized protein YndB with AHSA1/START domain